MVYRIFVEKLPAFASHADALTIDLQSFLGIRALTHVRVFNRYDVEGVEVESFERSKRTVFSEPQTDAVYDELPVSSQDCKILAVEYLPGQFDQRADSAAQCIQLLFEQDRPIVRNARVYCLFGSLRSEDVQAIKAYLINPVESQEASLALVETLRVHFSDAGLVPVLHGFCALDEAGLAAFLHEYALAMDAEDIRFMQGHFQQEQRDPTLTELRVIDTYWSDHCRHTTFLTELTDIVFEHPAAQEAYNEYMLLRTELHEEKPVTLMHLATIAAKYFRKTGRLTALDESEEINACTVKVNARVGGKDEPWLLLFKNETHNHPTEIEPFGGAATCIGGAIRDPLSGRAYVYQAMRVTGAGNVLSSLGDTRPGKLPQRKIATEAAAGYSSYGNQIGLATGIVDEIYHPGFTAKRMEIGAVVGAAPAKNVRRDTPAPGDVVLLLGGRTGRDGCGGATGSSKTHTLGSLTACAAEVQKGNAPEERKLQRLFRDPRAARMIKRCNDFGAGGVAVAIGELTDGLRIDLDAVPKKYEGLTGTELAISESQERMAVVVAPEDEQVFLALAAGENLEATRVAEVTQEPRLQMRYGGALIVDISRAFLNTNGANKQAQAFVTAPHHAQYPFARGSLEERMRLLLTDLNVCSKRGLIERFDSTIGAGTVLMPLGGAYQRTPAQAMAAKLPVPCGETSTCSLMAFGYNPLISEADPFTGAYLAVIESVAKLVASGAALSACYLTFQEYFARLKTEPARWGQPVAALLGALKAQLGLGLAAIGGKDSMSGSFEELDVPPTLVSFAVAVEDAAHICSPEFKRPGSRVALLKPDLDEHGLPTSLSLLAIWAQAVRLLRKGRALSAYTPGMGGVMAGLFHMCLGNRVGLTINAPEGELFAYCYGGILLETAPTETAGMTLGVTTVAFDLVLNGETLALAELERLYDSTLEGVYPNAPAVQTDTATPEAYCFTTRAGGRPIVRTAQPKVLIPVFPGTNCEYESAYAWEKAGAQPEIFLVRNRSAANITNSAQAFAQALSKSQILFLPGGFSGGDEPDGSAKFIAAFLRHQDIAQQITALLEERDGLIGGICNGFQALIKLGLLPFSRIQDMDASCPTLTFNAIGRHQSRLVRTRVASVLSPWMKLCGVGDVHLVPISHGEGRFVCDAAQLAQLVVRGQIATQYADEAGRPSMEIQHNPSGSVGAVEALTSPDGRVFGKMGHCERTGEYLYKNVPGNTDMPIFRGAVEYFQ